MAKAKVSLKARAKAKEIKVKDSRKVKANHHPKAILHLVSSRLNHKLPRLIMDIKNVTSVTSLVILNPTVKSGWHYRHRINTSSVVLTRLSIS